MGFQLEFTKPALLQYEALKANAGLAKRLKAVRKTLGFLKTNLRHPGLQTHEYTSLKGPNGEKVFEAYAEQKTPAAYRVFWYYGPKPGYITIVAITPHP